MGMIAKVLADNIRRLRKERDMTQSDLAEAIDVSVASIQNYESERIWPSIETVVALAEKFDVTETELFRDPNFRPDSGSVLSEFGRLLAQANPIAIEHALKILAEIGQPSEAKPAVSRTQRRTAKS